MKHYPHIEHWKTTRMNSSVIAFDKLDGQNIRCEWSKNRGWYKFGTKTSMFDETDRQFGKVIPVFMEKYGDALPEIFRKNKSYRSTNNIVVFCEWVGENSFSGRHLETDEMDIVLFDVAPGDYTNDGFVDPKDFVKDFGRLHIPKIIYRGNLTDEFIESVRNGGYGVKEGVMCKGVSNKEVWMVKVKTIEWLNKLKDRFGEEALVEEFK